MAISAGNSEHFECPLNIVGVERNYQIHVLGRANVAMCADCETARNKIANASVIERFDDRFQARQFHDPSFDTLSFQSSTCGLAKASSAACSARAARSTGSIASISTSSGAALSSLPYYPYTKPTVSFPDTARTRATIGFQPY